MVAPPARKTGSCLMNSLNLLRPLLLPLALLAASQSLAAPATRPSARTTARATGPSRSFTTQPTDAEMESLIAKLSSDDRLERQRAQDRLVEVGVAAEPRLRRLLK